MANARNSKIILCKDIKMDREYQNVLDFAKAANGGRDI